MFSLLNKIQKKATKKQNSNNNKKTRRETQKYSNDINLHRKITSTNMTHHSKWLVSVILLFLNEHYRRANKGKIEEKSTQT